MATAADAPQAGPDAVGDGAAPHADERGGREREEAMSVVEWDDAACELVWLGREKLRELARLPEPSSPLPGVLDSEPSLHLLTGKPKSGKTTFANWFAAAWAAGWAPWDGAQNLPGGRSLILSAEQDLPAVYRSIRRIAERTAPPGEVDRFDERLLITGQLSDAACASLGLEADPSTFWAEGMDTPQLMELEKRLLAAKDEGDPITLLVVDSLSRVTPPGKDENQTTYMTPWLDLFQRLAVKHGVYVLMIHHETKDGNGGLRAIRGSGAIAAVPRVLWGWEKVKNDPRRRTLATSGNNIVGCKTTFAVTEVAGEDRIDFFRPVADPDADRVAEDARLAAEIAEVTDVGEPCSLNRIALRVARSRSVEPEGVTRASGDLRRRCKAVLARAELEGWFKQEGGKWMRTGELPEADAVGEGSRGPGSSLAERLEPLDDEGDDF